MIGGKSWKNFGITSSQWPRFSINPVKIKNPAVEIGEKIIWSKAIFLSKVAFAFPGAYAEYVAVPANKLVKIPEGINFDLACSTMVQGLTAHYLVISTYQVKPGDTVLIHASAGGMGLLLCQLCKDLGATVIGTCSSEEKAKLSKEAGAHHVILYTKEDFVEEVKNWQMEKEST